MSCRGFTLVESLVAMAIIGLIAVAIVPAFLTQLDSNARSEVRTGSIAAAQQILEDLRIPDPGTLPPAGAAGPVAVVVGDHVFDVVVHYCLTESYCDDASRHLKVEVFHKGRKTYDAETVYTQLR